MTRAEAVAWEIGAVLEYRLEPDAGLDTRVMAVNDEHLPDAIRLVSGRLEVGAAFCWAWDTQHVALIVRINRAKVLAMVMSKGATAFLASRLTGALSDVCPG